MPIEIEVSEEGLTIHPNIKKRKLLLLNETHLLKGVTAKKIHADEMIEIDNKEFDNDE